MKSITPIDLAYIAGLTDGEGHIGVNRMVHKKYKTISYAPAFNISNTYKSILDWLQSVTEFGNTIPGHDKRDQSKESWSWNLRVDEIKIFLPQIRPYLKVKHLQADLILEYLSLETGFKGRKVPEHIQITRQLIWEEIRELNKKGPA